MKCAGVSDALSCAGVGVLGIPVVFLGSVRPGGPAPTEGPVRGEVEVVA